MCRRMFVKRPLGCTHIHFIKQPSLLKALKARSFKLKLTGTVRSLPSTFWYKKQQVSGLARKGAEFRFIGPVRAPFQQCVSFSPAAMDSMELKLNKRNIKFIMASFTGHMKSLKFFRSLKINRG